MENIYEAIGNLITFSNEKLLKLDLKTNIPKVSSPYSNLTYEYIKINGLKRPEISLRILPTTSEKKSEISLLCQEILFVNNGNQTNTPIRFIHTLNNVKKTTEVIEQNPKIQVNCNQT